MTSTTGQAQHTIRRALDNRHEPPGTVEPSLLQELQLALPWLSAGAPETLADLAAYLQRCNDPAQRRILQQQLAQGDDAAVRALVYQAFQHLRVACE